VIIGSMKSNGDAVVSLRLRGVSKRVVTFEFVIDTGFSDWLTLPAAEISGLGLYFQEAVRCLLADRSEAVSRVYAAELDWMGTWKRVFVMEIDGGALLGMRTVQGCYLGMEVVDGGRVEIRPLG
jgi:predicted aspartyl protease